MSKGKKLMMIFLTLLLLIVFSTGGVLYYNYKVEQARIEEARLMEEKRLEEERLEAERLEQERLEAERLKEEERLAKEKRLAEAKSLIDENREKQYELELINSMGINIISTEVLKSPAEDGELLEKLEVGENFLIKKEVGEWLEIELEYGEVGYIKAMYTMVNLPDIVPSIVYKIVNSDSSIFTSSFKSIPNVTGVGFYNSKFYNERLEKEEYVVPVIYPMAEKIKMAQYEALKDDNTLILYEAYRPYELQVLVNSELKKLTEADEEVKAGLEEEPWHMGWFIADGVSNHQKGAAIDVSLGKIEDAEVKTVGNYSYVQILEYEEYEMQTPMHELSTKSVSLKEPVLWRTSMAWQKIEVREEMTEGSLKLRDYCVAGNLEPIASEWWHFNDLEILNIFKRENFANSIKFEKVISKKIN